MDVFPHQAITNSSPTAASGLHRSGRAPCLPTPPSNTKGQSNLTPSEGALSLAPPKRNLASSLAFSSRVTSWDNSFAVCSSSRAAQNRVCLVLAVSGGGSLGSGWKVADFWLSPNYYCYDQSHRWLVFK